MAPEVVDTVIHGVCGTKRRYADRTSARQAAARVPAGYGLPVRGYRCPFARALGLDAHWHIGRVPDLRELQRIADAIRAFAQAYR